VTADNQSVNLNLISSSGGWLQHGSREWE